MACDVLITGSGSVSETTCRALALLAREPLRVVVVGRSRPWVEDLTGLCTAMSAQLGIDARFVGDTVDWDSSSDLSDKLAAYEPRLVFHSASLQSPWDFIGDVRETGWKQLVWSAGNAIILPLQAVLAKRVASVVQQMHPSPILVNVCFPDWVNPILHHLGLPIACGTGNVGMFSGFVKARYPPPDHLVQVVGHLYHFFRIMGRSHSELEGPRVWVDDVEVADVEVALADCFHSLRSVNSRGKVINELVGAASAEVILGLLGEVPVRTHVPGPNGLPGGYPVVVGGGRVELDLPSGCSLETAVRLNQQGAYDMGAAVIDEDGYTRFSKTAEEQVARFDPALAQGFHIDDLESVCAELSALRARLETA